MKSPSFPTSHLPFPTSASVPSSLSKCLSRIPGHSPKNQTQKLPHLPHLSSFLQTMRRFRGFRLGKKVLRLWSRLLLNPIRRRSVSSYIRLDHQNHRPEHKKTMTKICSWGRCLTKSLSFSGSRRRSPPPDYSLVDRTPFDPKPVPVPKGHLAVYVGRKDDDPHRVLVPVIYFNHPLFAELLSEAEREYGFNHAGGITIPCQISEFERVQTRIAAGESRRKLTRGGRS